ncbi:MAG: S1 RNA-binding domain-containing protein, partial [Myxococcota bacterium]
DRLMALRASFPPQGKREREEPAEPEREPEAGEVLQGKVRSLTAFGAFVALPERGTGLLHKSEIAHTPVDDPSQVLKVGEEIEVKVLEVGRRDGKLRIALSRKALLPPPPPAADGGTEAKPKADRPKGKQDRGRGKDRREDQREGARRKHDQRGGKPRGGRSRDDDKLASLGEMLLAKINQQKKDG